MGQFLRIVVVLAGVWIVLRFLRRALSSRHPSPPPAPPAPADMLRCDYCGTFVPRGEIIEARGKQYCSGAHADAGRSGQ